MRPGDDIDIDDLFRRRRRPRVVSDGEGGGHSKRRIVAVSIVAAVVLVLIVARSLVGLRVSYLFFSSLNHGNVFWVPLVNQLVLFLVGLVLGAAFFAVQIPVWRRIGANLDETGARIATLAGAGLAIVGGILTGIALAAEWQPIQMWIHGHGFNITEPVFGLDVSFFVFTLPVIDIVMGIAWSITLVSLIIAAAAAVGSSIAIATPAELPMPLRPGAGYSLERARTISMRLTGVLVAIVFLLSALGAHLTVYHMATSAHTDIGFVGPDATQLNVVRPIMGVLQWVAVAAALLVLLVVARGWRAPRGAHGGATAAIAVVWLIVNAIAQLVPPLVYDSAVVTPNAQSAQRNSIAAYLTMSRHAWQLDSSDVSVRSFSTVGAPTLSDLTSDLGTLRNVRIQDVGQLPDTFSQIDRSRNYQVYPNITVDRYPSADGSGQIEVMLSPREVDASNLNNAGFVNQSMLYTHGYGVTAVSVNQTGDSGKPYVLVGQQPMAKVASSAPPDLYFDGNTNSSLGGVGDPRIYCGYSTAQPVVVNTNQNGSNAAPSTSEFDYPSAGGDHTSSAGTVSGIPLDNPIDKLALSLDQFGGTNLFLSSALTPQSQALIHRTVQDRIQTLAPFLTLDADPYVVVDPQSNHLLYVADAYVTTSQFPDAYQLDNGTSYMRNSVKAVVDAKTCATTLYMVDPSEPLIATYNDIYPGLMQPLTSMPMSLRAHLRYPEDMFQDQARVYGQVHVTDPNVFYNGSDRWRLAQETNSQSQTTDVHAYYVEATLPQTTSPSFVLLQTFSPASGSGGGSSANNMTSWLAAECDYTNTTHPQLVSVPLNNAANVLGPLQFDNNINTNPQISQQITLLGQSGSHVILGNVIVLPFNNRSFLYVRPMYVAASSGNGSSFPQLQYVIVGDQNAVAFDTTFAGALQKLFNTTQPIPGLSGMATTTTPPTTANPPPTTGSFDKVPPGTLALLQDLLTHEQAAETALKNNDLVTFGKEEAQVEQDAAQLRALLAQAPPIPTASPAPSASPSASASASPTP